MPYPTASNLSDHLVSSALFETPPNATQLSMNLAGVMSGVVREFERLTGWTPFLSDGTSTTRTFDGPSGYILQLNAGLLSVSSLSINSTVYTQNQQFVLSPPDAASNQQPYTHIDFGSGWQSGGSGIGDDFGAGFGVGSQVGLGYVGSGRRAVSITGVWGYCSTLPGDVEQALLDYACYRLAPRLAIQISGGLYSERRLNSETRYGGGGVTPLSSEAKVWKANFDACVAEYRAFRL